MRRDSIFYKLFQQFPPLLFQLLPAPPPNADTYRFDSVAVKEPKFEIDGVFCLMKSKALSTFVKYSSKKTNSFTKEYLRNLYYIFIVIAITLVTGKQL